MALESCSVLAQISKSIAMAFVLTHGSSHFMVRLLSSNVVVTPTQFSEHWTWLSHHFTLLYVVSQVSYAMRPFLTSPITLTLKFLTPD